MNVPRELGRRLTVHGHGWRHVADIGMATASDLNIIQEARSKGEVIVTHDLDYGHLLAFSGADSPSVILFRTRNTNISNLTTRILAVWTEIEQSLQEGAIVILEDFAFRIRDLPILQHPQRRGAR